jgi:hypothetical protein
MCTVAAHVVLEKVVNAILCVCLNIHSLMIEFTELSLWLRVNETKPEALWT